MSAPDKGIPNDLLDKAQCVVIVPELKKAAFIVGGEYGRGFAVCRKQGTWGAPAAVRFRGGSFGAQIGAESTDIVMLVMSRHGMEKLATDKLKIGADASAAAGPVWRTAPRRRISSYTRRFCPIQGRTVRLPAWRSTERS
jgi:lipid-binding SYLF domain-containing protein